MSQGIKFHLDENVSNVIALGLRRRGIDVTTTSEVGLMGATDSEQLTFALAQERVIFTQDDDFLKLHQEGITHAGIVYCRQRSRSLGEIITTLSLLWECVEPEEMLKQVEFI